MRAVLAVVLLCLASVSAEARPSPYLQVTPFNGDRYSAHTQMGPDVVRAVKSKQGAKARSLYPTRKRPPVSRKQMRDVPIPVPRPLAYEPYRVEAPILIGEAVQAVTDIAGDRNWRRSSRIVQVIGGRPQGCPHRFCGCALALKIFGRIIPGLNLAVNWARKFQQVPPGPGMVAARHGHTFQLLAHVRGTVWQVWDANSGRGRTRIHDRSIAGYTIVNPHGGST